MAKYKIERLVKVNGLWAWVGVGVEFGSAEQAWQYICRNESGLVSLRYVEAL